MSDDKLKELKDVYEAYENLTTKAYQMGFVSTLFSDYLVDFRKLKSCCKIAIVWTGNESIEIAAECKDDIREALLFSKNKLSKNETEEFEKLIVSL